MWDTLLAKRAGVGGLQTTLDRIHILGRIFVVLGFHHLFLDDTILAILGTRKVVDGKLSRCCKKKRVKGQRHKKTTRADSSSENGNLLAQATSPSIPNKFFPASKRMYPISAQYWPHELCCRDEKKVCEKIAPSSRRKFILHHFKNVLANDPMLLASFLIGTPAHNGYNVVRLLRMRIISKDSTRPVDNWFCINGSCKFF